MCSRIKSMNKKCLILIPAFNESESIVRVVDNLVNNYPQYDYIIINDGSTDDTLQVCRDHKYNVLDQTINLGLAGTFQTGVRYALSHGYDGVIQFDADGQHRPEYIEPMLKKLEDGYDIIIASRFVEEKKPRSLRMLGSNIISFLIRTLTGQKINDPTSGMRLYSKRLLPFIARNANFTPEPDTIAYLTMNGAKVTEIQAKMDERTAGESYLTLGKSILYMLTVCVSIVILSWFRPKLNLEEVQHDSY